MYKLLKLYFDGILYRWKKNYLFQQQKKINNLKDIARHLLKAILSIHLKRTNENVFLSDTHVIYLQSSSEKFGKGKLFSAINKTGKDVLRKTISKSADRMSE